MYECEMCGETVNILPKMTKDEFITKLLTYGAHAASSAIAWDAGRETVSRKYDAKMELIEKEMVAAFFPKETHTPDAVDAEIAAMTDEERVAAIAATAGCWAESPASDSMRKLAQKVAEWEKQNPLRTIPELAADDLAASVSGFVPETGYE